MSDTQQILSALKGKRFSLTDEKQTQAEIAAVLTRANIQFNREHKLDTKNVPDFFIDGIAIEVKIKGNAKSIYRQCERYAHFSEVSALILVTNRSMGFPAEINAKPCYVIKLGSSWL